MEPSILTVHVDLSLCEGLATFLHLAYIVCDNKQE